MMKSNARTLRGTSAITSTTASVKRTIFGEDNVQSNKRFKPASIATSVAGDTTDVKRPEAQARGNQTMRDKREEDEIIPNSSHALVTRVDYTGERRLDSDVVIVVVVVEANNAPLSWWIYS